MNEKELDPSQINQIDMECNVDPDDDEFFLRPAVHETSDDPKASTITGADDRQLVTKLGIFADFSDDDLVFDGKPRQMEEIVDLPPLTVGTGKVSSMEQEILNAKNGVLTPEQINHADFTGINEIDTECSVGEDDDDFEFSLSTSKLEEPKLEEDLLEKKSKEEKPDGSVSADYWKKMQSKYNKANKKSMGPVHGHWCADPKLEMDMFNHDNTPQAPVMPTLGNTSGGQEGSMVDGGLMSLGEQLDSSEATEQFNQLLSLMGFEIRLDTPNQQYILHDKLVCIPDKTFKTKEELINLLDRHGELQTHIQVSPRIKDLMENHLSEIQLPTL